MPQFTVEAAIWADAIKRAALVAPTRGDGFDKAAGIVLRVDPENETCTVMATDTLLSYMEVLPISNAKGAPFDWRIPSQVFSQTVAKLKVGNGSLLTLSDGKFIERIEMTQARMKASFNMISMNHYLLWGGVDSSELIPVSDLGESIKRVQWAKAGLKDQAFNGIYFGPGWIGASDRYRIALQQGIKVTTERFMIPAALLTSIIPDKGDVKCGRIGNKFVIMPNPYTQIETGIQTEVPDISVGLTRHTHTHQCTFSKSDFLPLIERMIGFAAGDRLARSAIFIGRSELAVHLDNSEVGGYGDIVPAAGDVETHNRVKIDLNPANLKDAVAAFPGEVVTMKYNVDPSHSKTLCFTNNKNYNSMIAPLAPPPEKDSEE